MPDSGVNAQEDSSTWSEVRKNHEFMDLLNRLEATYPVDRWVIDGVDAWPVARIHLYYSFFDFQYFAREPVRGAVFKPADVTRVGRRLSRSVAGYLRAMLADRKSQQPQNRAYDALFLNYNTYMTMLDGTWYSRVCDPIVERLAARGRSSLMLTGGYEYSTPRHTPSVFVQPHLLVHRLAGMARRTRTREALENVNSLEQQAVQSGLFSSTFALQGPVEATVRQIRGIARFFKRVLAVARPKLVFVTCWYSTESMACVLACQELGIPSVDIQHGSQGFHVGYARWNRVPATGYNLLPTYFWCWSETEAAVIRQWSAQAAVHQPVVGGNLFLQRWAEGSDDTVRAYDSRLTGLKEQSKGSVHVLYTLNGSTKDEIRTLTEIIEATNQSGFASYFWVRLHPIALDQKTAVRSALESRGINNFDVDNGTLLPLYALIRHVDVHMTEFSSVVIEAQSFGVPSVISELGVINFPDQIVSGWAVTARRTDEWVSGLRRQYERRADLARETPKGHVAPDVVDELLDSMRRSDVSGDTRQQYAR